MYGCAVVYIPGATTSSSGSVTDGSATSAAKREASGDHTGSATLSLNDSTQGFASPPSAGMVIRRPPLLNVSRAPSGDQAIRPRSVSLRATPGPAPDAPTGRTNVSFCSLPITPSVCGSGDTYNTARPVGDTRHDRSTTGADVRAVALPLATSIAVSVAALSSTKNWSPGMRASLLLTERTRYGATGAPAAGIATMRVLLLASH